MPRKRKTPDNESELIDHLVDYINLKWDEELSQTASFVAAEEGDEKAARELIEAFVDLCDQSKILPTHDIEAVACLAKVERMLRRVLEVDMSKPSNRRGGIPKAMGLSTRRDTMLRIKHRIIYLAFDHVCFNTGKAGRPFEECAGLVASAIEKSRKFDAHEDNELTIDNIIKTYQRIGEEI